VLKLVDHVAMLEPAELNTITSFAELRQTYIFDPSGEIATPKLLFTPVLANGETTPLDTTTECTVDDDWLATYAVNPSGEITIPTGVLNPVHVDVVVPPTVSTTETVELTWLAT